MESGVMKFYVFGCIEFLMWAIVLKMLTGAWLGVHWYDSILLCSYGVACILWSKTSPHKNISSLRRT
jgi:hypothetical protein